MSERVAVISKDGQEGTIPASELDAALASGEFSLPPSATPATESKEPHVQVVFDGQRGSLPESQLAQAVASGRARTLTTEELAQEKYGGLGYSLAAAGEGLLRGVTLGGSDIVAIRAAEAMGGEGAGKAVREHLAGVQAAHPIVSTGAEIGGAIAPLAVPGVGEVSGASLLARGASQVARATPAALTAELGSAAARGAGAALEGTSALVQGAGKLAAQGAAEGAIFGAGHSISEQALHRDDAFSEKAMAAAVANGALWGAGANVALGGLIGRAAQAMGPMSRKTFAEFLDKKSGELAWRSMGATQNKARMAEEFGPGYAEIAKVWRDEAPALVGAKSFGEMTRELGKEAGEKGREQTWPKIEALLSEVQTKAEQLGAMPRAVDVLADFDASLSRLHQDVSAGSAEAKVSELKSRAMRILGLVDEEGTLIPGFQDQLISIGQMKKLSIDVRKKAFEAQKTPELSQYRDEFRRVGNAIEERITQIGDALLSTESRVWREQYHAAKAQYQAYRYLEDAAERGIGRESQVRSFGLIDSIMAGAATTAGATMGGVFGAAGGLAGGGLASRWVRTRGDFWGAEMLGKLSKLAAVERVGQEFDAKLGAKVEEAIAPTAPPIEPTPQKSSALDDFATDWAPVARNAPAAEAAVSLPSRRAEMETEQLVRNLAVKQRRAVTPDAVERRIEQKMSHYYDEVKRYENKKRIIEGRNQVSQMETREFAERATPGSMSYEEAKRAVLSEKKSEWWANPAVLDYHGSDPLSVKRRKDARGFFNKAVDERIEQWKKSLGKKESSRIGETSIYQHAKKEVLKENEGKWWADPHIINLRGIDETSTRSKLEAERILDEETKARVKILQAQSDWALDPRQKPVSIARESLPTPPPKPNRVALERDARRELEAEADYAARAEAQAILRRKPDVVFSEIQEAVTLASNPEKMAERVNQVLGETAKELPHTTTALARLLQRGILYLAATAPKPSGNDPLRVYGSPRVSHTDSVAWLERRETVENPLGTLDKLQRNQLTQANVEALEAVYPTIYQQIRMRVLQRAAEVDLQLQKRVQLGLLFNAPIEPTMEKDMLRLLQQNFFRPDAAQAGPPRASAAMSNVFSSSTRTDTQRLEKAL